MQDTSFLEKIQNNELYKKSISYHKKYQFMQFTDDEGNYLEGQQIRKEDDNGNIYGDTDFNSSKIHVVIYNFKNGLLNDNEDGTPAIQYPGHWENWTNGLLTKVTGKGGTVTEIWQEGIPVEIIND